MEPRLALHIKPRVPPVLRLDSQPLQRSMTPRVAAPQGSGVPIKSLPVLSARLEDTVSREGRALGGWWSQGEG